MIKVEELVHSVMYGNEAINILNAMTFTIADGETIAITGSSGSGKTTLLGLLAGLDVPSSGIIAIDGKVISSMNEDERAVFRGQDVGFVFQSFHLLPSLTALENVALPLELRGDKDATKKAQDYLEQVGLAHRLKHMPTQLSGGEQQRVAIARAFATQPRYLFADEPTGNLDIHTGAAIIDLLFNLNRQHQTTLIMVTHEVRLASLCQRQLVIESGDIHEVKP
jgi:putative ABC transport system ATP-binding protein